MTATVFIVILICLLTMRFFFTCLIVLLIGIFVLSDQPAHAKEALECRQSSFLFAKLAIASVNCNFPSSKFLAIAGETATHFCGKGPASAWPGSKAGAMAFFDEVQKQGKAAVCARIGGEMIGLENSGQENATKGECWGPPGDDICGSFAEVEQYKHDYKKSADCSTGTSLSRQNCKDAKAGKFD